MSNEFLAGKTAVVTGATRGIGYAVAEALLRAGATVAICGRTEAGVSEAVRRLTTGAGSEAASGSKNKVLGKAADVRANTEVDEWFAWLDSAAGGPDILVNNAGIGLFKSTAELTVEEWQRTLDTNLSGAFYCSRAALARMKHRGGGYIINIGSLAGKEAFAGGAAYNASKFGLTGLTEAMLLDHRHDKVRVTHIMPGSVDTAFSGGSGRTDWKIAPEDIGEVVLMVLRMPERTLVSRVEVRPSKPRK